MVTIRFDASNVDDDIREELESFMTRVAADLSNFAKDEAPVGASGRLRQSIQVLGYDSNDASIVVAVNAGYAGAVEFGREPGEWPNIQSLRKWVGRVIGEESYTAWGENSDWEVKTLDQATYIVGRSIKESGTEANPFMQRAIDRLNQKYS